MTAPGTRRRAPAPPREDVLAAMDMIAEHGLEKHTLAKLGREVGMSSGHLLSHGSAPSAAGCRPHHLRT